MNVHICQPEFSSLSGMREFYAVNGMLATSTVADTALIRSHVAYHSGMQAAERAVIKPSRGHSYKVNGTVVRISNHYDHRDGITGWTSR